MKVAFKGMANWERGGREGNKAALGDFIPAERAGSQGTSGSNTLQPGRSSGKRWGPTGLVQWNGRGQAAAGGERDRAEV